MAKNESIRVSLAAILLIPGPLPMSSIHHPSCTARYRLSGFTDHYVVLVTDSVRTQLLVPIS